MRRSLAILFTSLLLSITSAIPLTASQPDRPPSNPTRDSGPIRTAIQHHLDQATEGAWQWQVTAVTQGGDWAYATLEPQDRTSGQKVATEPLVALAHRSASGQWQVALPGEPVFETWLSAFPESLIDAGTKAFLRPGAIAAGATDHVTGYKVPWLLGRRATIVRRGGAGHTNQVDFNLWDGGTVWGSGVVAAAKGGTVAFVKESSNSGCPNLDCWRQANMVVLRHAANEYSWYVHLAHQSVPENIYVGATIPTGTPVGVEGETGFATGVHLHYMVSSDLPPLTEPSDPNAAPWPQNYLTFDFAEAAWEALQPGLVLTSQNQPDSQGCPASGGVILYRHQLFDCGGESEGVGYVLRPSTGWQDLPYRFNDQASSLRVPPGQSVRLYEHAGLGGASVCRSGDDESFAGDYFDGGQVSLNDRISSFQVFDRPECRSSPGPVSWQARYEAGHSAWQDPSQVPTGCRQVIAGPDLQIDWAGAAPCGDLPADDWTGEFRATVDFPQGEYVFHLGYDEGAQLWLDGVKIADHDGGGAGGIEGTRAVCQGDGGFALSGPQALRLLLWDGSGDAGVSLTWDTDTGACAPTPVSLELATGLAHVSDVEVVVSETDELACGCRKVAQTDALGRVSALDLTGCVTPGQAYDVYVKPTTYLRRVVQGVRFGEGTNRILSNGQALASFMPGDTASAGSPFGDNRINMLDWQRVQAALGTPETAADVNGDGVVDSLDLATVEEQWGQAGSGWTDASPCQALIGSAPASQPGPASSGFTDSPADQVPSLTLLPGNGDYRVGDEVDLEVYLDPVQLTGAGQPIAGVDLALRFDPGVVAIRDADPAADGLQIQPGPVFDRVRHNAVDKRAGMVRFSADRASGQPVQGTGSVATVPLTFVGAISTTQVWLDYAQDWTADTNVVGTNPVQDVLGQASTASFQIRGLPIRPSPSLTFVPRSDAVTDARHIEMKAWVADPFTQIQAVRFEVLGDAGWMPLGIDGSAAGSWGLVWDASTQPDGAYDLRAAALLPGGVSTMATHTHIVIDRTPPGILAASLTPTALAYTGDPVTIEVRASDAPPSSATASRDAAAALDVAASSDVALSSDLAAGADTDEASGIEAIHVYVRPADKVPIPGSWVLLGSIDGAGGSLQWDTTGYPAGTYQVAFDVRDRAGNQGPLPDTRLFFTIRAPQTIHLPLVFKR